MTHISKNLLALFRIVFFVLLPIIFISYCIFSIQDIGQFTQDSKHGGKIYLFIVGLVYFIITLILIIVRPKTYGAIFLISGVVIFDNFDGISNIVFPHFITTSYFCLWIFLYYRTYLIKLEFSVYELLMTFFVLSCFYSAFFMAENKQLAFAYTNFSMFIFLFVLLTVSNIVNELNSQGKSIAPFLFSTLFNMAILSLLFFIYETIGRGYNPITLLKVNFTRQFTGGIWVTAGFMEPVGFSLFASIFTIFVVVFIIYSMKNGCQLSDIAKANLRYSFLNIKQLNPKYIGGLILLYCFILIFASGSRSSLIGFFMGLALSINFLVRKINVKLKFKFYHILFLGLIGLAALYIIALRSASFLNISSLQTNDGGDTTFMYLYESLKSFDYLFNNFWGTGAMNSNLSLMTDWNGDIAAQNFINPFSFLFVLGGTYGWIPMLLYALTMRYLYKRVNFLIKLYGPNQNYTLMIVAMTLLIVSVMPLGLGFGPSLNWSPVYSPQISVVDSIYYQPKVYPTIFAGLIWGIVIGIVKSKQHEIY